MKKPDRHHHQINIHDIMIVLLDHDNVRSEAKQKMSRAQACVHHD